MKKFELELKLRELAKKVEKSRLIEKSREIAMTVGKIIEKDSANLAHYRLDYDPLKILYYPTSENIIQIYWANGPVFEVQETVNSDPKYPNPIVREGAKIYELTIYQPNPFWEDLISKIHKTMTEEVPSEVLSDAYKRFNLII